MADEYVVYGLILNWNNFGDTKEAVESLISDGTCEKILVLDNGSTDDSAEKLADFFDDNEAVEICYNGANLGFAGGMNAGIERAAKEGASHVVLMNDDATVEEGAINNLLEPFDVDDKVGITGPRIFYHSEPDRVWHGAGHISTLKGGVTNPEAGKQKSTLSTATRSVGFVTGCVVMISVAMLSDIGLFDSDYEFYYEDADLCLRAQREGYRVVFVPSAVAYHKIGTDAGSRAGSFATYNLARSRLLFVRKSFPWWYLPFAILIQILVFFPYRLRQIAAGGGPIESVWAWCRGVYDGLRTQNHQQLPQL